MSNIRRFRLVGSNPMHNYVRIPFTRFTHFGVRQTTSLKSPIFVIEFHGLHEYEWFIEVRRTSGRIVSSQISKTYILDIY